VARSLARAGLPSDLTPWLRPDVVARLGVDKKRRGDDLGFVTVGEPGDCAVATLARARLADFLVGAGAL
jgi:hypothetical protein